MVAAVIWVVLWADQAPPEARAEVRQAIQAERLEFVEARPGGGSPRAPELLRRANEEYGRMRFQDARAVYDDAIADAMASGAAGLSATELSDLFLGRALAVEAAGDSGFDDMVRAAQVAPTRLLDPGRLPPNVLKEFERAQRAVQDSPTGTLIVEAPTSATVFVDGKPVGRAPVRIEELAQGERLVRAEDPGRVTVSAVVTHSSEETRVRLEGQLSGPPTLATVVDDARARAVATVLIVSAQPDGDVLVERVHVARGRVDAIEKTSPADLRGSLRRMMRPDEPPPKIHPAVWLAGGAAVGVAITALVFLLSGDGDAAGTVLVVDPSGAGRPEE